jgi:hypothetical protein
MCDVAGANRVRTSEGTKTLNERHWRPESASDGAPRSSHVAYCNMEQCDTKARTV